MNVLLSFDIDDLNDGALLLKVSFLFLVLTLLVPFMKICVSLESHKSDLSIGVLNLPFLLTEYCPYDKSFTSIHFLVTNFNTVEPFNNLDI